MSAETRLSATGHPVLIPGVTPTSGKDAQWRLEVAWLYAGIAAFQPEASEQEHTLTLRQSTTNSHTPRQSTTKTVTVRQSETHTLTVY